MKHVYLLIGAILAFASKSYSYHQCDRTPEKAVKEASKVNKYIIEISGNPQNYTPGENYTITLKSNPSDMTEHLFYEFTLVAEPENSADFHLDKVTGSFHLLEPVISAFSTKCPNTVIHTNTLAKRTVSVSWSAPPPGSGCVLLRATVFESSDSWFTDLTDDSLLRKRLCEDDKQNDDIPPVVLQYCCACNEAKYEVAFQGLWSRNTHPKDFPEDVWKTKLGDIVGASHRYSKSFWNYAHRASDGLKLLAEEGNTSLLENELKEMVKNDDIRTIIKARELSHPKITGTSYTVFRVDQEHHLISLVSKITPSPDWIVGIANLELCLENCDWAESRTLNLYPWDVGTNDGLTYTANVPSLEPQPIRRIKSNSPNREESPFYSPDGEPVKPLAKLHLKRKKVYEKECKQLENPTFSPDENNCKFGEWSMWSSCSATCGKGVKTRDRPLLHSPNYKQCLADPNLEQHSQETVECDGLMACENENNESEDDCPNTVWSSWSPCSVTCDKGFKTRNRLNISYDYFNDNSYDDEETYGDEESENRCVTTKQTVQCFNDRCPAMTSESHTIVEQRPDGDVIDCKVTKWSIWSNCDTSIPCKKRYKTKERHILVHAQNGGKACPKKLQRKKKCGCKKPLSINTDPVSMEKVVDCVMGPWSRWSPCSTTCGYSVQQRTRPILVFPSKNGKPCEHRVQQRRCSLPQACNARVMNEFYRK